MSAAKSPAELAIEGYDYPLPEERIARYPLEDRAGSKLLYLENNQLKSGHYRQLPGLLPADGMIVFNDTRVVEARLIFEKESGGQIEIFCLEHSPEHHASVEKALAQTGVVFWRVMVGGLKKWKHRDLPLVKRIDTGRRTIELKAYYLQPLPDAHLVKLEWNGALPFSELLHAVGELPLPPYLNRKAEAVDQERYQTVYSHHEGSVAAPTAGLHFTPQLLDDLQAAGQQLSYVTLHVGAGTFKPVKTAILGDHPMHAEYIDVSVSWLRRFAAHKGPVTAVGTTSLRTLESLYWLAVQLNNDAHHTLPLHLDQWTAYQADSNLSRQEAAALLADWLETHHYDRLLASTQLLIGPGYRFRMTDGLITNFHQPQSTLLVLISAVIGPAWKQIYDYALAHDFRFLSYGDGMYWKIGMEWSLEAVNT